LRDKHLHVIGTTSAGKRKFLESLIASASARFEHIQVELAKLHGVPVAHVEQHREADPPGALTDWESRSTGQPIYVVVARSRRENVFE
jgi:hypothetical protein